MKLLFLLFFILNTNQTIHKLGKKQHRSKKHRKLFFPGFAQVMEQIPTPFIIQEYHYGTMTGGNININLPDIKNPPIVNTFPSYSYIENQPTNEYLPSILKRQHL